MDEQCLRICVSEKNILILQTQTGGVLLLHAKTYVRPWKDAGVVDRGGLENRCTFWYRGFESLSFRECTHVHL